MKSNKSLRDKMTFAEFDTNLKQGSLTKISETTTQRSSGTVRVKQGNTF